MTKLELRSLLEDPASATPTSRIVRILFERGSMSAAQISRVTGLAKSTVSMALAELKREAIVVEGSSESPGGVGRPATALTLNPRAGTCIGILVGLTEIQLILADVAHTVMFDKTVHLPLDYSPQGAQVIVRELIDEAYKHQRLKRSGLIGVGIAMGGPVNPVNGTVIRAGGMPDWAGVDLRDFFGPMFPGVPIFCDNESNCSAIAEMTWGAAQGHDEFIVYTLSLGVGGAIVVGGKVLRGIAGGAGEFGHMVIDPEGPPCRCGNRGCLETYANFRDRLKEAEAVFGRAMEVDEAVDLAIAGDETCRELIARTGELGGHGLGLIGSVFNPPLVVVSGRLAASGDILMQPLIDSYERYTLIKRGDVPEDTRTQIRPSQFVDNGACMGAVGLVLRHHGRLQ